MNRRRIFDLVVWGLNLGLAVFFLLLGLLVFIEFAGPVDLTTSQVVGLVLMVFALAYLNGPWMRLSRKKEAV